MDKKQIGYILIVFGIVDFVSAMILGYDLTYWLVGDLASFTPLIFGGIGWYLVNNAETETQTKIDDLDIEEDESIIHRVQKSGYIFTLTDKRIRYLSAYIEDQEGTVDNLPESSNTEYPLDQIESVKSVKAKDTTKYAIGRFIAGLINNNYGIQIKLKDNTIVNLAVNEPELVEKHINQQMGN